AIFGLGLTVAAVMPRYEFFGAALIVIGVAAQSFTTTANAIVQLSTEPGMRGRVMAILLAITLGGTPIGAPIVGWVADRFGPRWAVGVGGAGGFLAALVGISFLVKGGRIRLAIDDDRARASAAPDGARDGAAQPKRT